MAVEVITREELQEAIEPLLRRIGELEEALDKEVAGYRQAATVAGVSLRTLQRLVQEKKIPYSKHGKSVSFSRKDLKDYRDGRRIF